MCKVSADAYLPFAACLSTSCKRLDIGGKDGR